MKFVGRLFPIALALACCFQAIFVSPVSIALLAPKVIAARPQRFKPPLAYSELELGIIAEMNRARLDPNAYSDSLRDWRRKFRGTKARIAPGFFLQTKEGVAAVDEAIKVVENTGTVAKLHISDGLSRAARDHVLDQGKIGALGHTGSNSSNPFERINRYGRWQKSAGENISYGAETATAVVRDLIVDDGIPDRGHRHNVFRADYRMAGVACGYHKVYKVMCVISYAAKYREK
jgi:Cysteine-rich secretory protein family